MSINWQYVASPCCHCQWALLLFVSIVFLLCFVYPISWITDKISIWRAKIRKRSVGSVAVLAIEYQYRTELISMLIDANRISFMASAHAYGVACMIVINIQLACLNLKNVRLVQLLCIQTFGGAFCGGQPTNISVDIFCKIGRNETKTN